MRAPRVLVLQVTDSSRGNSSSVKKMVSYSTLCPLCEKPFKTLYSLKKHVRERHHSIQEDSLIPCFKDEEGKVVAVPKPREAMNAVAKAGYLMWLAGLTERLNGTFHPRLPGRFFKKSNGPLYPFR